MNLKYSSLKIWTTGEIKSDNLAILGIRRWFTQVGRGGYIPSLMKIVAVNP